MNRELFNLDLSIIIVSWNVENYLRNCLKSIYETTSGISFEIFVVDNASADRSVRMVKKDFPQVKLITNKENLGFPKANNQAIKVSNGKYILLLNPDTVVRGNALEQMVDFLEGNPTVGAVGPKIFSDDGTIQFTCARNFSTLLTSFSSIFLLRRLFPKSRIWGRKLMGYWDHKDNRSVECLSGACIMIRRKTIDNVGMLDDVISMYLEDTDICYRIRKNNWINYYLSSAEVVHFGRGSSNKSSLGKNLEIMQIQAGDIFFKKHCSIFTYLLNHVILFWGSLFRIILIGGGIILLKILGIKNDEFSFPTLSKYLGVFALSLGIYYPENRFSSFGTSTDKETSNE